MELVGQSIFQIVHVDDLTGSCGTRAIDFYGQGVALHVHVHREHGQAQLCQLLLLPMDPPRPSPSRSAIEQSEASRSPRLTHRRRDAGIDVFGSSRDLASISETQSLESLNCRRANSTCYEVACRVPSAAIAKVLFISQSTFATISPRSSGS